MPWRVLVAATALASAANAAQEPSALPRGELEAGGIYYDLDRDFSRTAGAYARGRMRVGDRDQLAAELVQLDRFDDDGLFVGVGAVHDFDDRWYGRLNLGTSAGGFFWPEFRLDSSLSRKWLSDKRLVSTFGISYFDARDAHTDVGYTAEASYYAPRSWVLQAGVTVNRSNPGGILSASGYGAVSHLERGRRIVSLRVGGGQQAYQALTVEPRFEVDVPFFDVRVTWKQWIGSRWGFNAVAGSYHSDTFDQRGVEVGVFAEF